MVMAGLVNLEEDIFHIIRRALDFKAEHMHQQTLEIHQKLDNLLTMASDQNEVLDSTRNGFEELKETVIRLETRVLEMEKENMGQQAKEKKLPLELSVGSYM